MPRRTTNASPAEQALAKRFEKISPDISCISYHEDGNATSISTLVLGTALGGFGEALGTTFLLETNIRKAFKGPPELVSYIHLSEKGSFGDLVCSGN